MLVIYTFLRNNINLLVIFECFGNADENLRIARQIGMLKEFKEAKKIYDFPYGYVLFNLSPNIMGHTFRVCTNYFSERYPFYPLFYTKR